MIELKKDEAFKIDLIYVPTKRRKTLDPKIVDEIAESMLEKGQLTPILIRRGWGALRARRRAPSPGSVQGVGR